MNWNGVEGEGFLDHLGVLPRHRIVMPAPRCSTRARRGAVRDLKLLAMAALGGSLVRFELAPVPSRRARHTGQAEVDRHHCYANTANRRLVDRKS